MVKWMYVWRLNSTRNVIFHQLWNFSSRWSLSSVCYISLLNFKIKCNSSLCHIRMTLKAENIRIITMWKEKSPAKNEMSLQNSINQNLRRISPWSKRFGGKTGETGLQERLVRTKAAMCSSIISVSMSLEFLNAPFCWISPWSWDRE